ncbi:Translation elongation factor, partial [Trema orientale]
RYHFESKANAGASKTYPQQALSARTVTLSSRAGLASSLSELEAPLPQALSLTVFTFNLEYAISQVFCPFFGSSLSAIT